MSDEKKLSPIEALRKVTTEISRWTNDKLDNKVDKVGGKSLSTNDYTTADKNKVANMPNDLIILNGKLFLAQDGTPLPDSAVTLPEGGGGGSSATITLNNLLSSNELTVAYGGSANLVFEYASSETDSNGTAYIYVGDVLKKTYSITPGENTLDIGELINEGINNVKLTVSDIYSNSKSLSFVINAISLKLTSTFDDSQVYSEDITVRYTPFGAVSKDIHLVIDGTDSIIATTSVTGVQQTYIINKDDLYHGAHDVQMYISATINDVVIKSNILYFCIVAEDSGVTTPIISSVCTTTEITQGEQVLVNWLCYDPMNLTTEVTLTVYQNNEIYSQTNRTVDSTKQLWSLRDVPIGEVVLEISYGVVKRKHNIKVLENDINIMIKDTDLEFQLYAEGKSNEDSDRDVWENNGITTTLEYVNYESTGWVETESGTALRLFGKAKAKILSQPFADDARQYGKTIELDFAIRDINNRNAFPINCMYGGIGFTVGADTATISSEQTSVSCNYTEEERIKVSFVIEPKSEFRLLYVYLDGILSGVKQYPDNDNFQQNEAQYIEIGSPYCAIDLYSIRVYNTCLSSREILNNYIASITDISEQLAVYEDNDIYDIYGKLSFDEVKERMPVVLITGSSLPAFKGDKKTVTIDFTHNEKSVLNYTDTAKIDIQGTSSQFYPRKNYKIKTNNYHSIDTDQIDTNVICIKCDFAESTSCRNTAAARFIHTLYGDAKVLPQQNDDRIRTTIYGYPVAVFYRKDSNATPEFLYKGNYNYDKSSSEAFGFISDYPDAFSIEFCNNTSDACRFHGEMPEDWGDDFEYRHPDGYENIEDSGFKELHSWVVSTYQDAADGSELEADYIGVDGTVYTTDTPEYRLAKFKKEFTDHFDMEFALIYYVYTFVGLYIDSRCKNLFLTTFDRQHFYCYFYDMDTSWAINNEGVISLSPYLTDTDLIDNTHVFNGQDSTLWVNFMMAFSDKIRDKYMELRSDGLITYNELVDAFIIEQCDKYSACMYNEDSEAKYISLLRDENSASYLYQVRGSGESHFRYFVKERLGFCDGYWNCGDYPSDFVSLRIYTPLEYTDVEPNANITITPYTDGYFGVKYKANGTLIQQRAYENTPILFQAPNETFDDTETAIYGASRISSLGDLSPLYCGTVDLSAATNLVEIIVGAGGNYVNNNLKSFSVGANNLLKKVDIRNCPSLTDALDLSLCPSIEEVAAQGSSITSVKLPNSGFVRKMHLPGTLTNLTVTNQQYIEEFTLEGYDVLTTLHIEDAVNIPVEDIMLNAPNLNRIRLIDVVWTAESEDALVQTIEKFKSCLGLDANGNNTNKAIVTGRVYVSEKVSDEVVGDIYDNFPDLIVDDGSEEIYIVNYKDWDGTILYSDRLAEGANAINPIEAGLIDAPFRESDANYSYEFIGWNHIPTNVSRHYQVVAQYNTKVAINFAVDGKIIHSEYVIYGQNAEDPVANGTIEPPTKTGTDDLHYIFNGWDGSLLNVTLPRTVNALFSNVYPVRFYSTPSSPTPHYVQWVKEGEDAYEPDCESPEDIKISEDEKLVFSAWGNPPQNVTGICQVYAVYDTYWAVRFYNESKVFELQWIKNGSSATEPTEIPTKTSTAQYDFTFSSWEGDYTNITESKNIIALYNSILRKYNVYFYNDNTLLRTVENVSYGSSTSYIGPTPTKLGVDNPEEYIFKGWMPAPDNITGETECYALFKFTGYLFGKLATSESADQGYGTVDNPNWDKINAYWDVIANDVALYKNGTLGEDNFKAKYPIGGRMIIPVNLASGMVTADVEIIGYEHDDFADGSGKAPLTFFCVDLPQILHRMNPDSSNDGGYEVSEMREFVNEELFNALPDGLKAIIKSVTKISDGGSTNKTLVTTADNCWLASYDEVGLVSGNNNLSGQGTLYSSIFSSSRDTRKKYITDDTATGGWWLRSSYYSTNSNSMFWRVTNSGGSYSDIAFNSFYVAFGFCIDGKISDIETDDGKTAILGKGKLGSMILGKGNTISEEYLAILGLSELDSMILGRSE